MNAAGLLAIDVTLVKKNHLHVRGLNESCFDGSSLMDCGIIVALHFANTHALHDFCSTDLAYSLTHYMSAVL